MSIDWSAHYAAALTYEDFLGRHATPQQLERWRALDARVRLSAAQRELLATFGRAMPVFCLAGAWCGDCINQCPILEHFGRANPLIQVRYLDRDADPDVRDELRINGGARVPVVVFLSEDGMETARFGERTLSKYRQMVQDQLGPSCPTGIAGSTDPLLENVIQDWLDQFERVQWILRLSPRLRAKHGD